MRILQYWHGSTRCRQAKLEGLEQQIQEVEQRIEAMQVEKARCQAECDALEQVTSCQSCAREQAAPDRTG